MATNKSAYMLYSGDLSVSVKLKGKTRSMDLSDELSIETSKINMELAQQPSKFAWFAVLAALADDQYNHKVIEKKALYAKLDKEYRESRSEAGEKITEGIISSDVESDPEYVKLGEEVQRTRHDLMILNAAVDAFRQRKDCLISIATNLRAELDGELTVLKDKAKTIVGSTKGNKH